MRGGKREGAGRKLGGVNKKLSNASDALADRMWEQGDKAAASAMDKPLKGPLGEFGPCSCAVRYPY